MLFVDAHVHIYDCYDLAVMFDAAFTNFRAESIRLGKADDFYGVLLLTDRKDQHWFDKLFESASQKTGEGLQLGNWRVSKTSEKNSLVLSKSSGEHLVVIGGRQLVSSEGLEVLALLTPDEFEEGQPAAHLVDQIAGSGGVPVTPWAFGKWFGARGKVLRQMIDRTEVPGFFLGDNGGRPSLFPCPNLLQLAEKGGWEILSGSDPLPITGDEKRVGSFGIYADIELNESEPAAHLRSIIKDKKLFLKKYGVPMNVFRFVRNQLALRGL